MNRCIGPSLLMDELTDGPSTKISPVSCFPVTQFSLENFKAAILLSFIFDSFLQRNVPYYKFISYVHFTIMYQRVNYLIYNDTRLVSIGSLYFAMKNLPTAVNRDCYNVTVLLLHILKPKPFFHGTGNNAFQLYL